MNKGKSSIRIEASIATVWQAITDEG